MKKELLKLLLGIFFIPFMGFVANIYWRLFIYGWEIVDYILKWIGSL